LTDPRAELAHDGTGDFLDVVDVQVMDDAVVIAARIARAPAQSAAGVTAIAIADEEPVIEILAEPEGAVDGWERAVAGPLQLTVDKPLERWTLSLDAPGAAVSLELRALTPPLDLDEPATASIGRAAGVRRYAQLCEATGTARIGERSRTLKAQAVRTHRWGPVGAGGRTRFLTAATRTGTLVALAAVRPPGTAAHGEELVGGQTIRAGSEGRPEPLPFETVRVSTVFDEHARPVKAGAELFRPGDELPSRLAGMALAGGRGAPGSAPVSVTLFRFALDGVPAVGSYEIEGE
jgi:hypothetical protein